METLETEIKKFANGLPYWAKYLAENILSSNVISDNAIDTSYSYLLEELGLNPTTEKPEIEINYNSEDSGNYKLDLLFSKLENVEGVNALTENQIIEFHKNLTIIYGANGSGKSGYVRLLKKAFYSKAPEEILRNIHVDGGHKSINASFTFNSNGTDNLLSYPKNEHSIEFKQFSVFDGKSILKHLEEKNEFAFRPAGLSFFADYTKAIERVEQKIKSDINAKNTGNTASDLADLFDGESEIKTLVKSLSASTKIEDLNKYAPFSEEDGNEKEKIIKEYDELVLASKNKEKEIKKLENIKKLLADNKRAIETINCCFTTEYLTKIKNAITDCLDKEATAKSEGIEQFKTDKIAGIGSKEWKSFIEAAEAFATNQKTETVVYPEKGDHCLLCHQPLTEDAEKLIANYWAFIRSVAEESAKNAQAALNKEKQIFEKFDFDLFPDNNTLTIWLSEKYPNEFNEINKTLSEQKMLAENIISDIKNKTVNDRSEINTSIEDHVVINEAIDATIEGFQDDEQSKKLKKFKERKTYLEHKEKFNAHFSKFETYINHQVWINKADKADFAKRKTTETEKFLSRKYFNQKYIDAFNQECNKLNGSFDIEINHTSSAGKSHRELKLKGNKPNMVLSEGEQKIIALADFIAEMQLSEVNKGIILDDPVTSLDEKRKSEIAKRLADESNTKQVIIFTHDLVFVSSLIEHCKDLKIDHDCHWIENSDGNSPGTIWLRNTPSYEKDYKTSSKAQKYYDEANKLPPESRENKIKQGFAALRTSYEAQVVFGLFNGVVQRFNERVSVDSLRNVSFTDEIRNEFLECFSQCCRYMEGHLHSDKYANQKPTLENLNAEIKRFDSIAKSIKSVKRNK
ncbi:MAG: AAA family ATPase [Saprospiraceae bacterium]